MMIGVAECDERMRYAPLRSKLLRGSGKDKKRFAAGFSSDVDVAPTHGFADSGAEGLRHSFLSSKSRGEMSRGKFHRHRILNFAICEDAMKKTVAKTIERMLNARAFNEINTDADHTHPG